MRCTVVGCSVAIWRRSISSCNAWTDQRTHARPTSAGGVQARATISTRCRGGEPPRAAAAWAVSNAGQPLLVEAAAPALHPIAGPMEVAGDGHVAPSLHSQEDDLRAVDQPPFGRAGAAEVLKGGALLGGQRDDDRGRRTLSTNTDGYVHGSYWGRQADHAYAATSCASMDTVWAAAQMKPANSRAIATTAT